MNRILVYGMTDNLGGIESYVMNLYSLLDTKKAIFDFVVDFPNMSYRDIAESKGSLIHFIPAKSKDFFNHLKGFYKILIEHPEYKKIYFNVLDAGSAITMLIPWIMGRKIMVHSHSSSASNIKLHKICKPFLNLFAKKRYACSRVAAKHMFYSKSVTLIPNAIACSKYVFSPGRRLAVRQKLDISEDDFVLGYVGRLSVEKNLLFLLDVFKCVLQNKKNARFIFTGDGEEKDKLYAYANEIGVCDKVDFLGRRSDVFDILQAYDVFCMTSIYEGLSFVAIEAQASGLPCVFSSGMSSETKINDNVVFVSLKQSPEEWADVILAQSKIPRCINQTALQLAGYDLGCPNEAQKNLLEYFY